MFDDVPLLISYTVAPLGFRTNKFMNRIYFLSLYCIRRGSLMFDGVPLSMLSVSDFIQHHLESYPLLLYFGKFELCMGRYLHNSEAFVQ